MNPDICVMMATYKQRKYLMSAIDSIRNQWPFTPRIQMFLSWVWGDMKNSKDVLLDLDLHVHGYAGRFSDWERMSQPEKDQHVRIRSEWMHDCPVEKPGVWTQKQDALKQVNDHFHPDPNRLVCFFDSDDIMIQDWFAKAIPVAQEIISKGKVPIVCPSFRLVDENLNPISDTILPEFSMARMLESCIIPEFAITTIGAMNSVGGFFDPAWDVPSRYKWYAMMLRMLKTNDCEVVQLPDIGFLYRQHKGQDHAKYSSKWRSRRNVKMLKLVSEHYFPKGGRA